VFQRQHTPGGAVGRREVGSRPSIQRYIQLQRLRLLIRTQQSVPHHSITSKLRSWMQSQEPRTFSAISTMSSQRYQKRILLGYLLKTKLTVCFSIDAVATVGKDAIAVSAALSAKARTVRCRRIPVVKAFFLTQNFLPRLLLSMRRSYHKFKVRIKVLFWPTWNSSEMVSGSRVYLMPGV
jgi:hypothetical protein